MYPGINGEASVIPIAKIVSQSGNQGLHYAAIQQKQKKKKVNLKRKFQMRQFRKHFFGKKTILRFASNREC